MKPLEPTLGLTERVYQALLDELSEGRLIPGQHLVQENIAAGLGVSRQPVQQALAMLRNDGVLIDQGKRGLVVAPVEPASMCHRYEVRAALDGLAARRAAERVRSSPALGATISSASGTIMADGRSALAKGSIAALVQADIAFHEFIAEASGNPFIRSTAAPHWRHLRWVMGEVLRRAGPPTTIWRQHQDILDAILAGDAARAEAAAVAHVWSAADRLAQAFDASRDEDLKSDAPRKPSPVSRSARSA